MSGNADVVPARDLVTMGSVTAGSMLKTVSKAAFICALDTLKPFRGKKAWFARVFKKGQGHLSAVLLVSVGDI